jgi:hypothetical protein
MGCLPPRGFGQGRNISVCIIVSVNLIISIITSKWKNVNTLYEKWVYLSLWNKRVELFYRAFKLAFSGADGLIPER